MNASPEGPMKRAVERRRRGECRRIRVLAGFMEWRLTRSDTVGHYCVLETFVPPGTGVPPHQHADHEAFHIVEGTLEFARFGSGGLEWFPVAAGDSIHVPGNEIHGFRNTGSEGARILVTATAALGAFFQEAGVPVPPGAPAPTGPLPQPKSNVFSLSPASTATGSCSSNHDVFLAARPALRFREKPFASNPEWPPAHCPGGRGHASNIPRHETRRFFPPGRRGANRKRR